MLELLLSLDHEASKLFEWLEPEEMLNLSSANHAVLQACEHWCQTEGLPGRVALKQAEIAGICASLEARLSQLEGHPFEFHGRPRNPNLRVELSEVFESYQGFLNALLCTPLDDEVLGLPQWRMRYLAASQPRPRAIRGTRFDYGYARTGYWCDAFGSGAPNDYFRLVGDAPTMFWSFCPAGSDVHHIRWRNYSNNDSTNDPVPVEASVESYTQTTFAPTAWDRTRQYWKACGARVPPSN